MLVTPKKWKILFSYSIESFPIYICAYNLVYLWRNNITSITIITWLKFAIKNEVQKSHNLR